MQGNCHHGWSAYHFSTLSFTLETFSSLPFLDQQAVQDVTISCQADLQRYCRSSSWFSEGYYKTQPSADEEDSTTLTIFTSKRSVMDHDVQTDLSFSVLEHQEEGFYFQQTTFSVRKRHPLPQQTPAVFSDLRCLVARAQMNGVSTSCANALSRFAYVRRVYQITIQAQLNYRGMLFWLSIGLFGLFLLDFASYWIGDDENEEDESGSYAYHALEDKTNESQEIYQGIPIQVV